MVRTLILLLILLTLSSCGKIPSFLLGGGPNVAANTQIGKENSQNIGVNTTVRPVLRPEGPVDTVVQDNSTTKNTEIDPLLIILLILGWLAPSPSEIGRSITKLFRRKNS
jgi:hypothetical protein